MDRYILTASEIDTLEDTQYIVSRIMAELETDRLDNDFDKLYDLVSMVLKNNDKVIEG